ncbi:hypothetical protein [uncultured phage cr131_1]|uniref:Uncharacterized protein n=1 Tax=uncultured phage cr131_1 TaxID=2772093 RepID=A0A7M1RTR7_9CAUD|nr:hypothetical protein KNV60_gp71 [uncultured phage cr131_1]QOR57728.1 hypothetical protein [uncultured phage cr131_1]
MRDIKDFQARYDRWKNGERYWDIRGVDLPRYDTADKYTENIVLVPLDNVSIDEHGNALIGGRIMSVAQLPEVTITPVYNTVPSQIARPIDFRKYSLIDDIKKQNDMFSGKRLMNNIRDNYIKYWQDTYKMPIKINDGGWTKDEIKANKYVHNMYDPTSSIDPISWMLNGVLGGNLAKGEEDLYWRAYLGLSNVLPKASNNDLTEWDFSEYKKYPKDNKPDYYGITNRMRGYIQAMGDTLNLGKLAKKYPDSMYPLMYKFSKQLLDNPFKWLQADDADTNFKNAYPESSLINEWNPLGMLAKFGAMWDPNRRRIQIHDEYDFPWYTRISIPKRKNKMFIRGSAYLNPLVGSDYFNTDSIPNRINYEKEK